MKSAIRLLCLALLVLLVLVVGAFADAEFDYGAYMISGHTLPYRVLLPEGYTETQQYPLLVFLHGMGERGNDNEAQLTWGSDWVMNNFYSDYPAIVIMPQCPDGAYWSNVERHVINGTTTFTLSADVGEEPNPVMRTLMFLVRNLVNSGRVDTTRVYATGLSMGGWGTYELLWRMPDVFAAAIPIAGGGNETLVVDATASTPMWIFHGDADPTVNVHYARDMYAAMQAAGRDVQYTEYPGVGHDSWEPAWKEPTLVSWMYGKTRTA